MINPRNFSLETAMSTTKALAEPSFKKPQGRTKSVGTRKPLDRIVLLILSRACGESPFFASSPCGVVEQPFGSVWLDSLNPSLFTRGFFALSLTAFHALAASEDEQCALRY